MMITPHVACVVAASTMRKTARNLPPIVVRIRVPQVVVRGVAGVAAVQALRGVPGKTPTHAWEHRKHVGKLPGGKSRGKETGQDDAGIGSAIAEKTPAETEEETIRLKSLSDLTFPSPPENAAQALGFINQTLMAIGKVQRTAGDEVYKWGQDCMTLTEGELKADPRFPRLDREIAAKLIRSCRKGRFGLMFQQQVEQERTRSGGMPNGCCLLRAIFRHFQLERDRIGMLAERNLLNTRLAGGSLQDLEDFRDKYLTTIPDADLPKPSTLFNHLIDELDKCPTLKSIGKSLIGPSRASPRSLAPTHSCQKATIPMLPLLLCILQQFLQLQLRKKRRRKRKRKRRTSRKCQPLLQKERARVKAKGILHLVLLLDVAPHAGGEEVEATPLQGQIKRDARDR